MQTMIEKKPDNHKGLRTWVEIDSSAILNNYKEFRKLANSNTKVMSVVKSNAYGHELVPFALLMEKLGVDEIAVDSIAEGLTLRREGLKIPILVLGNTLPDRFREAEEKNITLTVSSMACLDEILEEKDLKIAVHIKVDTGMSRQGFSLKEMDKVMARLQQLPKDITIDGLYTHFAQAKNPAFSQFTQKQIDRFKKWQEVFAEADIPVTAHCGATSGAILYPDAHFDMVRIGIGMYGLWPSLQVESYAKDTVKLKPVLTWKSVVGEVKVIPKGESVGYDLTEVTKRETVLAVCPVGYWHGYTRLLSSVGKVLIHGEYARVIGRVSMDMIVVDVTDIEKVQRGDEVTLLGTDGKNSITATDLALLADTVNYEIVTCINPKIRRIYD